VTLVEAIVVVAALVVAGAVAIVHGSLEPALAGILGAAIGYGGGRTLSPNSEPAPAETVTSFKGAPDA
jgi:hypothetical protein